MTSTAKSSAWSNGTEGMVKDVWQTAWDRLTVQIENTLADWGVNKAVEMHNNKASTTLMNAVIQRVRQVKHVDVWAHGQGGAVTALALHRALRQLSGEGLYPIMRRRSTAAATRSTSRWTSR